MDRRLHKRSWRGLVLSIIVLGMVPLLAATNVAYTDEPWPDLLANEAANVDPAVALLQQRASASLERLGQSSAEGE